MPGYLPHQVQHDLCRHGRILLSRQSDAAQCVRAGMRSVPSADYGPLACQCLRKLAGAPRHTAAPVIDLNYIMLC